MPGSSTWPPAGTLSVVVVTATTRGSSFISVTLNVCSDNSHQLFPAVILLLVHNENRNSLIRICLTGVHEEKMQTPLVAQLDCDSVANLKKKKKSFLVPF